ncbi:MAG: hypothetical protein EXS10_06135 [Phycisphaerales bacterium]|nr:hypothetical protein [Phycisphaerales bacterium]
MSTESPSNGRSDEINLDARDQFVDAVVSIALTTTDASRRARVDAALELAFQQGKRANTRSAVGIFWRLRWAGIAAAATLAVALVLWPSASGSSDLLAAAARMEAQVSDRSFDFRIDPPPFNHQAPPLFGRLDVRSAEQMLLLIDYPDGTRLLKGRDGSRSWMRDRNGVIEEGTSVKWPGWVANAEGSLVVDSIATLIAAIDARYDIAAPEMTTLASGTQAIKIAAQLHIEVDASGERVSRRGFDPTVITLWLDSSSRRVLRAETEWDPPQPRSGPFAGRRPVDAPPARGPPRRGIPDDRPPSDRPLGDRPLGDDHLGGGAPPRDAGRPRLDGPPPGGNPSGGPELLMGVPGRLTITLMSEKPFSEGYFAPESYAKSD